MISRVDEFALSEAEEAFLHNRVIRREASRLTHHRDQNPFGCPAIELEADTNSVQ